jgi:hypothetical protein
VNRTVLAFLVAPLWVTFAAAIIAVIAFPYAGQGQWILISIIIGTVVGYGPTWLLGGPVFLLLRRRNHTSLWLALVLGFVTGGAAWLGFGVLFALWLRSSPLFTADLINFFWVLGTGTLGSIVGASLWLIARPDRPLDRTGLMNEGCPDRQPF